MTVTLRTIRDDEIEAARALLMANGWDGPRVEPARFAELVARAQAAIVAVDGARVVGFARALGDGLSNGYLSMLVVDAAYRRRGVGRRLVERVMGEDPDMTWVLRARGDSRAFYAKLGFKPSEVAMERVRRSPAEVPAGKAS